MLDDRVTTAPLVGAGPVKVTVPVELDPPITDVGLRATPATVEGLIVRVAVKLTEFSVPVIVALVTAETAAVVTVKVAVVAPEATVTDAGAVAFELFELRLTTKPPAGAGPFRATVPVEAAPPIKELGASDRPDNVAGLMVNVAV